MTDSVPSIVVAGDVCIDWLAIPIPRRIETAGSPAAGHDNWRLREGLRMLARPGGAWLLADLVSGWTRQRVLRQPIPEPIEHQACDDALHSMVELGPFRQSATGNTTESPVWRVKQFRGFAGPDTGRCDQCMQPIPNDHEQVRLVVLDDVGNGFRERTEAWPLALRTEGHQPIVLWKVARPLSPSPLAALLLERHAARTVVILDVDDLRAAGAAINRQLSWERTAGDAIRAILYDRTFSNLRRARHLVVRLDVEGALCFTPDTSGDPENTAVELTYLPSGIEGSTRAEIPGEMLGLGACFTAAVAASVNDAPDAELLADYVRRGVRNGIAASRQIFSAGLGPASASPATLGSVLTPSDGESSGYVTAKVGAAAGRDVASRLLDYVRTSPLEQLADRIIVKGIKSAVKDAPIAKFGALVSLDRSEMETFRSIHNLIGEYLALPNPERPLSIAVFGPPGSGKSFGVAQVAKSISDVEKVEFNVSQFVATEQLTAAFHVVRDAVVRGRVPLAFFDEFDTSPDGQRLPWLKHFLAPMQDGKFMDGGFSHLLGRAIFVFAGGTRHSFAEFAQLGDPDFIRAKGPDFVSRLRGVVDVRGTDRREPNDELYVVRRAVLLRSMFTRKTPALLDATGTLNISPSVRRAFLRCYSFVHGARSMESIIDMSLLAGRETFESASLPSPQQLELHVNAEEFMELVNHEVRLSQLREPLGRAIHARFLVEQADKKSAQDPSMQPWERLPENYREDNRLQADDITRKLSLINCACRPVKDHPREQLIQCSDREVEIMAEAEHERWCDSKRLQQYTYAPPPKSDKEPKTHPSLLPWSDLSEPEKDKDRDSVKAIPEFLASVGYEVFRLA